MATTTTPVGQDQGPKQTSSAVLFDLSNPPVIEGFSPASRVKDEGFKEKFIRKTKENPFVPLGKSNKCHPLTTFAQNKYMTRYE